ncbi:CBASS cGAMP-activated phospholipase [Hyphomonas pacifica]|uniref:Uncharacterized protein n=1 Tax=Hyphomonas pacifica TaxID=1280941 RepID=A0A062U906_9PROT|nr:CBASS cGAMP-activated phospholipase [Hyphomonas pacifica]KCZ52630.1 hypothetical protein HY2_07765 [Hyphomonas pacifica]RAN32833.1 hypothetical protein HY3_13955 [Hyphomonas pacifica]
MASNRFQILALSGGGYRGLFGAEFLASCEAEFEAACAERFNLIAGTSIGALLAAGLAASVPAKDLADAMRAHGPDIFKRNVLTGAKQFFLAAPYAAEPIQVAVRDVLGETLARTPLSAFEPALAITTVNYSTGETAVLRSKGLAGKAASNIALEDAILASAAAPTFFPTRKIGVAEFIDGGLVANAPDMIALLDARRFCNARFDDVYQLSIGTAGRRQGAAVHDKARAPGAVSWVARRGLVQTIMAAQEHLALEQVGDLLQARFLRIDAEPAQNQVKAIKALDRVSDKATATLQLLAGQAWQAHKSSRALRDFFKR